MQAGGRWLRHSGEVSTQGNRKLALVLHWTGVFRLRFETGRLGGKLKAVEEGTVEGDSAHGGGQN